MNDLGAKNLSITGQFPRLGRDEIVRRVEELFDECWDGCFPIDVEKLCDNLGIAIVPVRGLRQEFDVEAFITVDFSTIYVDMLGYINESARYRFSVAHELGHFVLHQEYYPSRLEDFEEWMELSHNLNYVEYQANYFAGSLLAPEGALINLLNVEFGGSFAKNCWLKSKRDFMDMLDNVQDFFGVSRQVIVRRIRDLMPGTESFEEIAITSGKWR